MLALEKLETKDKQIQKIFDKIDNRTNTFLSISLGIFSLQVTLLTNTILNIHTNYILQNNIMIVILVLFISNIILNLNAIFNFRRSSKISEKVYSPKNKTKKFNI